MSAAVWIGIVVSAVVVVVFGFSLFRTSKQASYVMPTISTPEALRLLLEKAQREVDALNGVRR